MAFHIKLSNGERINAAVFDRINRVEDGKLPNTRKSAASLNAYKKHFKVEGTIPVPEANYCDIRDYTSPSPRKFPQEYVVYEPKKKEDYDNIVEYDYDDEDANWLNLLNAERKKNKEKQIDHETFEIVMDRLEKECVFELKPSPMVPGSSEEHDDVCCVCCDGETTNVNQIIYCDMCNIAVHQDCYGVPYIPAGQWLCRKCKLSPSTPVECCLCPNTTGAFKQTADGRWAHVICAIWLNEVHFGNAVFLEPIEGVDLSLRKRAKLKCLVCRQKMGACLQCSTRSCLKAFHVTCAQNSGMSMQVCAKEDKNQEDGMDVQRYIYCHLHTDDDESGGDINARKKRMENAIRHARRNMANLSGQIININMPTVSRSTLEGIKKRVNVSIHDIVEYWYLKRKSRCGTPLIRRLQMQLSTRRPSGVHVELTDEDKAIYNSVNKVRIQWENTRLLCELVKKREVVKHHHVTICKEIFHLLIKPLSSALEELIDALVKKDKSEVFTQPVTIEGYRTIIKQPMDLSTMKKRVKDGKISSFADLRSDFNLMMDNCTKFNTQNEWYLSYGKRYRKMGMQAIQEAEKAHQDREKILADTDFLKDVNSMRFYESLRQIEEDHHEPKMEISEGEDSSKKDTRPRRISTSASTSIEKKPLAPKRNIFGVGSSNQTPKRKAADALSPPSTKSKRNRKDESRQSTMDQFVVRTVKETPLNMAWRDNSVTSPKMADSASSAESSTDDDRPQRPTRNHNKRGFNGTLNNMDYLSEDDGLDSPCIQHNDIVNVNGVAGRAMLDTTKAQYDPELPNGLLRELLNPKTSKKDKAKDKEPRICVLLFDPENKWGWYPIADVTPVDNLNADHRELTHESLLKARNWYKAEERRLAEQKN